MHISSDRLRFVIVPLIEWFQEELIDGVLFVCLLVTTYFEIKKGQIDKEKERKKESK